MTSHLNQIRELLQVTNRLASLLEREIGLLRQMDPKAMQNVQQEKIVLAAAYQVALSDLRALPQWEEELPADLRQEVHSAASRFQAVLIKNERALRAAKETTERVLSYVVEEIDKQKDGPKGYGKTGAYSLPNHRNQTSAAVAINQRL